MHFITYLITEIQLAGFTCVMLDPQFNLVIEFLRMRSDLDRRASRNTRSVLFPLLTEVTHASLELLLLLLSPSSSPLFHMGYFLAGIMQSEIRCLGTPTPL